MVRLTWLLVVAVSLPAQVGNPEQLFAKAIQLHQSGNVDQAIEVYQEYLKLRPERIEARSNLGAALVKAGRYQEAIDQYRQALERNPQNAGVRMNLALAYYKSADIPEARKEFAQAHTLQPDNLNITLLLAECDLRLGDNKQAIDLLTPLQTTHPDDLAIAYLLGTALIRDKQISKGQVLIDRILRNGDSAEARLLLGTSKLAIRDFTGALKDLEQAVKLNPDLPGCYSYFALARLQTGDAVGAAEAFREALKRDPNDYEANLNLGALAKQDREYDEAIRYLNKAASVRPGDLAALYQIAGVNFDQGRSEEARSQLEKIVKSAPDFTEGHVMLATVYYRLKRKSDGDAERAIVQKLNEARQAKEPGAQPQ